jgi:predicted NUDIX family NTP pyrophosphohydrolase
MPKRSAGLLPYRWRGEWLEVFLVHPGGPFWQDKDLGAWSIAKGEHEGDDDPLAAARREFEEEVGRPAPSGDEVDLGHVRLTSGKIVAAFAVAADFELEQLVSNTFTMEWPPRSGVVGEFPDVDRAEWMRLAEAREKLNPGQVPLIDHLEEQLRLSAQGR